MEKKNIKQSTTKPIILFLVGCAFYVYYGITWNAWMENLPKIIIYAFIVAALWWTLRKKEEIANKDY